MIRELQNALRSAGATDREVYVLAGISYILTNGKPGWTGKDDGKGAWGISQKWYPGTPSDLPGQARQALTVYRSRGLAGVSDNLPMAALTWWYPNGVAPASVKVSIESKAADYAHKVRSGSTQAGLGWGWILVVAVVVGILWRK